MNPKHFADRLNIALDLRHYPSFGRGRINYIQEIFNISRSGANKWLHGRVIPHAKARRQIAEKLGINLHWLETGEGEPALPNPAKIFHADEQVLTIPILTLADAYTYDRKEFLNSFCQKNRQTLVVDNEYSPQVFAVKAVGKAMEPKLQENHLVIIDPTQQPEDGDFIVAKSISFPEAILRQFIVGSQNNYLIALNPKFQPIKITKNEEIIGKVIEIRSDFLE